MNHSQSRRVRRWLALVLLSATAALADSAAEDSPDLAATRRLAEQGASAAQFNLGVYYLLGQDAPQDYSEAVRWFRMAAKQDDAEAQYNLAMLYAKGLGVPQDSAEAVRWFRMAAEIGHAKAQNHLALMIANGQGVPRDYVEAAQWYRKAAEQGLLPAQMNLINCYLDGRGVPQDLVQAYAWMNMLAAIVPEALAENRDALGRDLTPSQLERAQALSQELWEKYRPRTSSGE